MVPKARGTKRKAGRPRKQDVAKEQKGNSKTTKIEFKRGRGKGRGRKNTPLQDTVKSRNIKGRSARGKKKNANAILKKTFLSDLQKFSDSEEIDSILNEICDEENGNASSDSEVMDSVLKEMCEEEEEQSWRSVSKAKNNSRADDRLEFRDDDSNNDETDMDNILDEIAHEEEEICSRVDGVQKKNLAGVGCENGKNEY